MSTKYMSAIARCPEKDASSKPGKTGILVGADGPPPAPYDKKDLNAPSPKHITYKRIYDFFTQGGFSEPRVEEDLLLFKVELEHPNSISYRTCNRQCIHDYPDSLAQQWKCSQDCVEVCQPGSGRTGTRILIPKDLWKPCELYPKKSENEVVTLDLKPPFDLKPVKPQKQNKLPLHMYPGSITMEVYKKDSNMISFDVAETMLSKKSKIPSQFLSKYKQQEGTIGDDYLSCLKECISNKQYKLKDQKKCIEDCDSVLICNQTDRGPRNRLKHCKMYKEPFDPDAPFDVNTATEFETVMWMDDLNTWATENDKDPCEKLMDAGIPCGRELLDDPFTGNFDPNPNFDPNSNFGPNPNFAPHSAGFFPINDYEYALPEG